MKNNTLTIIKKEFARFFGDRQMFFTTVIMPGLLIYLVYSLMGNGISKMVTEGANEVVAMQVENMPQSLAPMLISFDSSTVVQPLPFTQEDIAQLEDKDINAVLVRFPADFDMQVAARNLQDTSALPNVEIYYNSTNNASKRVYYELDSALTAYEESMTNLFDVNRADNPMCRYDQASVDDVMGDIWSKILPMIIIMMLFSGTMAIAPSAIAGEKERGTIATLLVTPMHRNQLALGKIISLSGIALLSGISSFIGIALSLPKMIHADAGSLDMAFNYTTPDYVALLLVILASVLIMAASISLISAFAKDVKNAGTMVVPFMLVVMLAGMLPMLQNGASDNLVVYLIPFYNAIEVMTAVFAHSLNWTAVLITLGANIAYTGIAVWGLTRMFNSEKIMFSK